MLSNIGHSTIDQYVLTFPICECKKKKAIPKSLWDSQHRASTPYYLRPYLVFYGIFSFLIEFLVDFQVLRVVFLKFSMVLWRVLGPFLKDGLIPQGCRFRLKVSIIY